MHFSRLNSTAGNFFFYIFLISYDSFRPQKPAALSDVNNRHKLHFLIPFIHFQSNRTWRSMSNRRKHETSIKQLHELRAAVASACCCLSSPSSHLQKHIFLHGQKKKNMRKEEVNDEKLSTTRVGVSVLDFFFFSSPFPSS